MNIRSSEPARKAKAYRTLNAAKFEVIHDLERRLPAQPYTEEWGHLDPDGTGKKHSAFHQTEVMVPFVFIAVHAVQAAYTFPWQEAVSLICRR